MLAHDFSNIEKKKHRKTKFSYKYLNNVLSISFLRFQVLAIAQYYGFSATIF